MFSKILGRRVLVLRVIPEELKTASGIYLMSINKTTDKIGFGKVLQVSEEVREDIKPNDYVVFELGAEHRNGLFDDNTSLLEELDIYAILKFEEGKDINLLITEFLMDNRKSVSSRKVP